jgi:hypothetical protein
MLICRFSASQQNPAPDFCLLNIKLENPIEQHKELAEECSAMAVTIGANWKTIGQCCSLKSREKWEVMINDDVKLSAAIVIGAPINQTQ